MAERQLIVYISETDIFNQLRCAMDLVRGNIRLRQGRQDIFKKSEKVIQGLFGGSSR